MKKAGYIATFCFLGLLATAVAQEPIIADHNCTDLPRIPSQWIDAAKSTLHIAYGHTSHGSQVTDGMTGLVGFTGGCGGPQFEWNNGGTGGALDLHDYAMGGDCGYYPQWVNETRDYLDNPANSDVNVIIWSWCGQHSGYSEQQMIDRYLAPMTQLEIDYPDVMFVYMTGHLNYYSMANTNARNQQIRDYCLANDKILFDFAHIESFDPDGTYYPYANDDCRYWDEYGTYQGNWAENWQNSHTQNVDWYYCGAAHSKPLNSNQKAYAVWWLWARLAGWDGVSLGANQETLEAANGGALQFDIYAGPARDARDYTLFATFSGTSPGTTLPGGLDVIPLNRDGLTDFIRARMNGPNLPGFTGTLDADGRAAAALIAPSGYLTAHIGKTMSFAYALRNPWDLASDPVSVIIVP